MKFHIELHVCCLLQSSCTKPDLEAESAHMENTQEFLQPVWGKILLNNMKMKKNGVHMNFGEKLLMHDNESAGKKFAKFYLVLSYLFNSAWNN